MLDNEFKTLIKQPVDTVVDAASPASSTGEPLPVGDEIPVEVHQTESSPSQDNDTAIPAEETPPVDTALLDGISQLSDRLTSLEKLFEAKILHTEHEEKILDQMHRELQKYKEDMYSQLVRPILLDMIEIRDSILRVTAAYLDKPEGEQSIPVKTFSMYAADVQEILEKNNIEIFRSEKKADFVPVRQRAIKKTATNDQSLHGKVAESLSDGYSYNGKTISAEKVVVYFYEQPQPQAVENNEEETNNG